MTKVGLTASSVTARTATLTISDNGDSWYYQADAAPHTTCRGPVSTTTQALSGLAPSTTYTYSAYSASNCAEASKLATAAPFTTLASGVSVSNLSETARANGIDIIADSPEATGFTTGGHATGYTLQSVVVKTGASVGTPGGGLSKNQSYTFKAYSDGGCATLIATAPAFTTTNPALAASNVISNGATLTLTGWAAGTGTSKDGNWYYKADAAPHTACSTAQTTGTVALSGLTVGGTYTYTAYSDTGCTTSNSRQSCPPLFQASFRGIEKKFFVNSPVSNHLHPRTI